MEEISGRMGYRIEVFGFMASSLGLWDLCLGSKRLIQFRMQTLLWQEVRIMTGAPKPPDAENPWLRVWGVWFRALGFGGFRGVGFTVQGLGFRGFVVYLGCRVWS